MKPIYLDHLATTPCDPRVVEAMLPFLTEHFGNAGSRAHAYGWAAEEAVKIARESVAALLGATPREIVFTSGATESNNLAIKGVAEANLSKGRHVVTQITEHKAVLEPMAVLEQHGFEVTRLAVDDAGRVDPAAVAAALRPDTILVSVMHANNELGTVQPIREIAGFCNENGTLLHTDAAQTVGKIPVDVEALGVDLLSLSGHKMYAPKGVGALYVRRRRPRIKLSAQLHGGGQERSLRAGTHAVHQIVALGAAARIALAERDAEAERLAGLRDRLEDRILSRLPDVRCNGHSAHRLPGACNLSFGGVEGEGLITALRALAISTGSACLSATLEPSHVLRAIGVPEGYLHASLRFGLGRHTTAAEVERAADLVVERVAALRVGSQRTDDYANMDGKTVPGA